MTEKSPYWEWVEDKNDGAEHPRANPDVLRQLVDEGSVERNSSADVSQRFISGILDGSVIPGITGFQQTLLADLSLGATYENLARIHGKSPQRIYEIVKAAVKKLRRYYYESYLPNAED